MVYRRGNPFHNIKLPTGKRFRSFFCNLLLPRTSTLLPTPSGLISLSHHWEVFCFSFSNNRIGRLLNINFQEFWMPYLNLILKNYFYLLFFLKFKLKWTNSGFHIWILLIHTICLYYIEISFRSLFIIVLLLCSQLWWHQLVHIERWHFCDLKL